MDWNHLLTSFDGRISRQPFWLGTLALFGANIVVSIVLGGGVLGVILGLVLIYPSLAVSVKRWHDRGKSGWWVLVALIPVIGWIWTLVECGFLEGTKGSNEYGPDPLEGSVATV
jgi:uncharacterized membrane protein YhaH (DUF805 family)